MKILVVTGSRDWRDIEVIQTALTGFQQLFPEDDVTLRQGCATGADAIARSVADFFRWEIEDYWPDYMSYDFATANKVRNVAMVDNLPRPEVVFAFPTVTSKGTWHTVKMAKRRGISVQVYAES